MDLCLRGSQINLVTRQKPKPKYSSHTNLLLLHQQQQQQHHQQQHASRPRSASFYTQHCRRSCHRASPPFAVAYLRRRPQSAEAKFGRRCGSASSNYNCPLQPQQQLQRRYQSISSSNLLKLLLDEPIKRSWLCRGSVSGSTSGGLHSPEDVHSDWSLSARNQQPPHTQRPCARRQRCESLGSSNSSLVEHSERLARVIQQGQGGKMATAYAKEKSNYNNNNNNNTNTAKNYTNDYWRPTPNSSSSGGSTSNLTSSAGFTKTPKPDLPGRVSFCKSRTMVAQPDVDDSSDCDNDKQDALNYNTSVASANAIVHEDTRISAPGPLSLPNFQPQPSLVTTPTTTAIASTAAVAITTTTTTTITTIAATTTKTALQPEFYSVSAATEKKSVHFGAVGSAEVYAETYEYPKCPSENCSCSTRSSSTASLHDVLEGKCACASPTCRYALEAKSNANANVTTTIPATTSAAAAAAAAANTLPTTSNPLEESAVIREYKNVVGEQLENSIVKNLLAIDDKVAATSIAASLSFSHLNNGQPMMPPSDYLQKYARVEKQNNLSEAAMRNNALAIAATAAAAAATTTVAAATHTHTTAAAATSALYKTANSKRNLLTSGSGVDGAARPGAVDNNNFDQFASAGSSSSETVINNYLKVAGGSGGGGGGAGGGLSAMTKKQENVVKPNSAEVMSSTLTCHRRIYNAKHSNNSNNNNNYCNSNKLKAHNSNSNLNANAERTSRLRKSTSYSSLRGDDTNLNEFQLDKVDSWMSMHQAALSAGVAVGCGSGGGGNNTSKSLSKLPTTNNADGDVSVEDEVLAVIKQNKKLKLKRLSGGVGGRHSVEPELKIEVDGDEENDSNLPFDGDDDEENQRVRVRVNRADDDDDEDVDDVDDDEENSQYDSTYEEIVSVIKEIEENKKHDNYAENTLNGSEMNLKMHTPTNEVEAATTATGAKGKPTTTTTGTNTPRLPLEMDGGGGGGGGGDALDKYKDILNYLDNVEDSCDKTLLETRRSMPESNRSEVEFVVEPDIAEDVPKLADLLLLPNHQLARRVVALSLRANELANALHLSKEHVSKIRLEKQKCVRAEKANTTQRMREQKKHYETIVQRHQNFIEQLLKDKATLCEKVAVLTRRLESQNQAWEHRLETEVTRVKETTMAGEKIRRERWVRENTKKIKELTVKGLEAEINKLTNAHQLAINELKRAHQQQLLDTVEETRLKHEQIENGIRETCAHDRETIIEKERNAIRERFERQLEEERRCCDEQKQKLCEDFAMERERLQHELKAKEADYQQKRQDLQREKEFELEQALSELQQKMSKQEEKYQNRINTIERQYESDFEIWKREHENSCKLAQVDKENNIRHHYRAERDRQIDAIVTRMDAEALKNADEFEAKVNRLKEKYEKDLNDVENVEKSLRDKYTETRSKLAESDAQVRNCQAEIKQLQIELEHSKKMCGDFVSERDQLREHLRQEIQNEVSTLKAERDQEIQKIHKRVQQAVEKKDATIDILQKENGGLRERCLKLEAVIRQQRKDYCVK